MALILYSNLVRSAVLSATSELTPVARLIDPRPSRPWIAADNDATVTVDFGSDRAVTHIGLVAHNLSIFGHFELALAADGDAAFAAPIWTKTVEAWSPTAGLGDDPFGLSLGGYPDLSGITDFTPYKVVPTGDRQARYLRIRLVDDSLDQVSLGWVYAGIGKNFVIDFGWTIGWEDSDQVEDTDGATVGRTGRRWRVIKASLNDLTSAEALVAWDDLARILGRSRPLLVQLFPEEDEVTAYRTTLYGQRAATDGVAGQLGDYFTTTMTIRELRA